MAVGSVGGADTDDDPDPDPDGAEIGAASGAVQVEDDLDGVAGSDGTARLLNVWNPLVTALTFSIQSRYRHSTAGLEEFLRMAPARQTWSGRASSGRERAFAS
jgi:hypothetical protein